MSYCINPACQNPQNPPNRTTCDSCGSKLLLQGRYRALELLGEGGMGRTFLAIEQENPNNRCIIKQYLPVETSLDPSEHSSTLADAIAIFNHDAQRRQVVGEHPQIPSVRAYFEEDKRLYLVEDYIEGQSLQQQMQQQGAFDEIKIRELLDRLLPVFQFMHERQVIHRDVKPDCILRSNSDELVVMDFGVSKHLASIGLARTGSTIGTEGYAPPEQIRGGLAYPASDLYSLGVTCIQLLTGEWLDDLFDPLDHRWVWREQLRQKGTDVSDALAQILDKLLKDRVNERYQSAAEVLADLESLEGTPETGDRPTATAAIAIPASPREDPPEEDSSTWRCQYTLKGHDGWVWTVAFSPDGKAIASGGADRRAILWNPETGERIRTLEGHSDLVLAVAFSQETPLLATSSRDKNIILWNAETGERIRTLGGWFSGHSELVNALAFSPDGSILASGSWDRKIILWNHHTGKRIRTLRGHSSWVYSLTFSPDGLTLASGSRDTTLMLWNVRTGRQFFTLYSDSGLVNAVAFSPDGGIIASGNFNGTIALWDVSKGEQLMALHGHSERVNALAFSPDGKILASASRDRTIVLWDMSQGTKLCTLTEHTERVFAVAFSPDGKLLASASGDETVKIWRSP